MKKADATLDTIFWWALVLIAMVLILFLIFKGGDYVTNWIKNLPGYTYNDTDVEISNFSADELTSMGCKTVIGRIMAPEGGLIKEQYIYVGSGKTNLYWHDGNKKIYLDDGSGFSSDPEVGYIAENYVYFYNRFLDEKSYDFINNKEKLPDLSTLKLLDRTFKLNTGNYLCRKDSDIRELKECNFECSTFEGNCKDSCSNDEFSYGNINCKEKLCCVTKSQEKLAGENITIDKFEITNNDKRENFIGKNSLDTVLGRQGVVLIDLSAQANGDFCYVFRTNENILMRFNSKENFLPNTLSWTPSTEKTIELRAWSLDKKSNVGKRIFINNKKLPDNYEDGEVILDNQLKQKLFAAENGKVFYVMGLLFDWKKFKGETYTPADYKIKKIGNNVEISVYNLYPDLNKWHVIDCYSGWGLTISAVNLRDSLTETIINSCTWN